MSRILAIESSCDETAVAITDDGKLLANNFYGNSINLIVLKAL